MNSRAVINLFKSRFLFEQSKIESSEEGRSLKRFEESVVRVLFHFDGRFGKERELEPLECKLEEFFVA